MKNDQLPGMLVRAAILGVFLGSFACLWAAEPAAAKASATLARPELIRAVLKPDWLAVGQVLAQNTDTVRDPREALLLAHAALAGNSNNNAAVLFAGIKDSVSRAAWLSWTAQLVASHPESPAAHYLHGDALARTSSLRAAAEELTTALSLDSTFFLALNARGVVYDLLGSWDSAAVDFDRSTYLRPGFADAYANLGVMFITKGISKGAGDYFSKAIVADPKYGLAYSGRACALVKLGEASKARGDAAAAESLCPAHPFVILNYKMLVDTTDTTNMRDLVPRAMSQQYQRFELQGAFDVGIKPNIDNFMPGIDLGRFSGGATWETGSMHSWQDAIGNRGGVFIPAEAVAVGRVGTSPVVGSEFALFYPRRASITVR